MRNGDSRNKKAESRMQKYSFCSFIISYQRRGRSCYIISAFCILLYYFLISCSVLRLSEHRPIQGLVLQDSLSISYPADKVSYSVLDRTFFILNTTENTVRIYKNGSFFNIIGGSGFGNENFRRLADIFVGIDGSLYALDSFDRVIKRFDKDGIYVSQFQLHNVSSPERFAMTSFGAIFVYDAHNKEIYSLDPFDMSVNLSFGKFQIDKANAFFNAGDFINIYDNEQGETAVFLINGLFEDSYRSFTFFDAFQNILSFSGNRLVVNRDDRVLFSSNGNIDYFAIERDFFIFLIDNLLNKEIRVYRGIYETR